MGGLGGGHQSEANGENVRELSETATVDGGGLVASRLSQWGRSLWRWLTMSPRGWSSGTAKISFVWRGQTSRLSEF